MTEAQLEASAVVAERYPILLDTARVIADPLVRNRATVCGNIAHGDPANDHPATMLALRAHVVATGPGGERTIDIDDFFHGLFMTALGEDEILTELHIPVPPAGSGGAYVKLERKVGDYAVAGAAVQLTLDDDGVVTKAGVGLTNLGFAPIRATAAEETLMGADFVPAGGLRGAIERVRDAITKGARRRRGHRRRRPGRGRHDRARGGPARLRRVQAEHGPCADGESDPHGPRASGRIERWRHIRSASP